MTKQGDWPNRLRAFRKRAGLTLEKVAQKLDLSISQISRLERGQSDLTGERLKQFAEIYGCQPADILGSIPRQVPLVGYVGAGAEVYPFDDSLMGGGLEEVEAPPGYADAMVAVRVRGDSMFPVYRDGDLIYYSRDADFHESECLGAECVVKVVDGPTLVKTVMRGSANGLYSLLSYNAPPIADRRIEWAAPVLWVDKRRRLR
jgi:phage repressor protein C with HTH and peptisase S24 domain